MSNLHPETESEFQRLDYELDMEDAEREAREARTEDEYLDAMRHAGRLGGCARPAQPARDYGEQPQWVKDAAERHYQQTVARMHAFRVLGDGPALSREWHDAKGCYGSFTFDYDAAIKAELAARREVEEV